MGDFLNRVVPPFNISPGAGTLGVITQYKLMGAAVVGTATVLKDMLNGVYDPAQWEIDVIKATTGANVTRSDLGNTVILETKIAAAQTAAILTFGLSDGGAYYDPGRAFDITLPTWTAAQTNPFTIVTYVVLVGHLQAVPGDGHPRDEHCPHCVQHHRGQFRRAGCGAGQSQRQRRRR